MGHCITRQFFIIFIRWAFLAHQRETKDRDRAPDAGALPWIDHMKDLGVTAVYIGPLLNPPPTGMIRRTIKK